MADCCWSLKGSGLGNSALYNLLWCEMEMGQPRNNTHNRNSGKQSGRLYPPHCPPPGGDLAKPLPARQAGMEVNVTAQTSGEGTRGRRRREPRMGAEWREQGPVFPPTRQVAKHC